MNERIIGDGTLAKRLRLWLWLRPCRHRAATATATAVVARSLVQFVTVVLRSDEALLVELVGDRLILTTVSEGKLVGRTACCEAEQLVAETNAEHGLLRLGSFEAIEDLADICDGLLQHLRIPWSIGQEEPIVVVDDRIQPGVPRHDCDLEARQGWWLRAGPVGGSRG